MTDTKALRTAISESGLQKKAICRSLGMSYATLRNKVDGHSDFTVSEMTKLCALLNLSVQQREEIFFTM